MPPAQHKQLTRRQQRVHGTVRWGMGAGRAVELPVTVDRMIPPEADICEARLSVRRIGPRTEMQVAISCVLPDPDPKTHGPDVSLHLGWRPRDDGSVRVATWAATEPVSVPDHLSDVVVVDDTGTGGEIVVPARMMDVAGRPHALQGQRDAMLAPVADRVAEWLDQHPQPAPSEQDPDRMLTGGTVRRWRNAARWVRLTRQWEDSPPAGDGAVDIVAMLTAWAGQDQHLWEWQAHERHQVQGHRNDRWRNVAAWLATMAGRVVVDSTDLTKTRQRGELTDDDPVLPGAQQTRARARAQIVAPGELRATARATAGREGVPVVKVDSAWLSRTCPHCGRVGDADPRYAAAAVVTCPACGKSYDQDRSAARLMLERASMPS